MVTKKRDMGTGRGTGRVGQNVDSIIKEIMGSLPRITDEVNNAVKRSQFEILKQETLNNVDVLDKYQMGLYQEVNDVLDHSYSLGMVLNRIDEVNEVKEAYLSLYHTCCNVCELDDTLHYLAYLKPKARR